MEQFLTNIKFCIQSKISTKINYYLFKKIMLEELIPYYPDLSHNDAQLILYAMAEFNTLEAKIGVEKRVKPGEYYKHQQVLSRLSKIRDRILLLAETGTGKTCGFVSFDELLKSDTDLFKAYYYITLDSLIETSKRQIICKCTNNKYINDKGRSGAKKNEVAKSDRDSFKENYILMNYYELYIEIVGKSADELREKFGHCVFNMDEITEIINVDYTTANKVGVTNGIITWEETINQELLMLNTITDIDDPRIRYAHKEKKFNEYEYAEKVRIELGMEKHFHYSPCAQYIQIWRMLHAVQDISKAILATGTIIKNRPSEALIIANLALPMDKQFNLAEFASNIFTYNLKRFAPYLNGLISYVKSSNIVAKPNYIGKKLPIKYNIMYPVDDTSDYPEIKTREFNSGIVLYKVELFNHQARKFYSNIQEIMNNKIESSDEQYICYVDTNGNYGNEARFHSGGLNFLCESLLNRMNCAAVFSEIYRIELSAYRNGGEKGPGVCFNYLPLTNTVLDPLKKIFSTGGVFEVLHEEKHFEFLHKTITGSGYCETISSKVSVMSYKPRAVFLTGETKRETIDLILDFAGSPDNVGGKYIQFINGSKVLNIGINVKNGKRFTRAYPGWNEADDKQAKDRVFREDSHDEIRKQIVQDIYNETGELLDLYHPRVNELVKIDVYNMCAFSRFFYVANSTIEYDVGNLPKFPKPKLFDLVNRTVVHEIINGEKNFLLKFDKIYHLVGFTDNPDILKYNNTQVLEYCKYGETLELDVDISRDLSNLTIDRKYIIFCYSGVVSVYRYDKDIKNKFEDNLLLYHDNCDFMKNYMNGIYINECKLIRLLHTDIVLGDAVEGRDYKLYNVNMKYLSSSEEKYIELEKKSFPARRLLRIFKRSALDYKVNKIRTYHDDGVDYSLDCDYDVSNYTGICEALPGKSEDSFIYEDGNEFWTNYEVLYSANIIDECKEKIIHILSINNRIRISDIFRELLVTCNRDYFINMAIYDLVSNRYKICDTFGISSYICSNDYELFLNREFPKMITNIPHSFTDSTRNLIAIKNNPDYRTFFDDDKLIIEDIESLHVDVTNEYSNDILLNEIIQRMKKMTYSSYKVLLERCFTRIAYDYYRRTGLYNSDANQKKQVDDLVCGVIFSVRCVGHILSSGEKIFFHNQQKTSKNDKYNESNALLNFLGEISILSINQTEAKWIVVNKEEEIDFLKDIAVGFIRDKIDSILTKETTIIRVTDGTQSNFTFHSQYYLSKYNGTYRIIGPNINRNIANIGHADIKPHLENILRSYLCGDITGVYYNNIMALNYTRISALLQPSIFNKDLLKEFFIDNNLVFKFSLDEINV